MKTRIVSQAQQIETLAKTWTSQKAPQEYQMLQIQQTPLDDDGGVSSLSKLPPESSSTYLTTSIICIFSDVPD